MAAPAIVPSPGTTDPRAAPIPEPVAAPLAADIPRNYSIKWCVKIFATYFISGVLLRPVKSYLYVLTILYELSERVGFEPMLVRPPGVWVDDKEDSAIVAGEGEEPKVEFSVVSTCLEDVRGCCSFIDEHLELSTSVSLLEVVDQKIVFLTAH